MRCGRVRAAILLVASLGALAACGEEPRPTGPSRTESAAHPPGDAPPAGAVRAALTGRSEAAAPDTASRRHAEWLAGWADDTSGGKYVDATGKPDTQGVPASLRRRTDGQEMVLVPAGTLQMGHGPTPPLGPVHRVRITRAFYMDASEVTLGQFNRYSASSLAWLEEGGQPTEDSHPAESVTFEEALGYAKSVGADLPTEAEWEWAARRDRGWAYPWGNEFDPLRANGRGDKDGFSGSSAPVRSYPPDSFGLYDLCGNVSEWCLDAMDGLYYMTSPAEDPLNTEPRDGQSRVMRGGSYDDGPERCSSYVRIPGHPDERYRGTGFRCVVRLPK